MVYRKVNDEVLYSDERVVTVSAGDLVFLKEAAARNSRKRVRFCTHAGLEDKTHEMFIVHGKDAYVRPHKHLGKSESFHTLEGEVDIIVYDDNGQVTKVIEMGDMASGKVFYYRIDEPLFHTLRIRSEWVCFKEVTAGPFNREATLFAPWSPEETDTVGVVEFMRLLHMEVK